MTLHKIGVALVLVAVGGCATDHVVAAAPDAKASPARHVIIDGPSFNSIDSLATAATVVVEGNFKQVAQHTSEGEFESEGSTNGLPIAVWTFQVNQVLQGSVDSSNVMVARVDTDSAVSEAVPAIDPGSDAVVFLTPTGWSAAGAPVFTVVGMDQGRLGVGPEGELSTATGTAKLASDVAAAGTVAGLQGDLATN